MNNFTQRTFTGIIFVVVMAGAVVFSQYTFIFLFFAINLLGLMEFYRLLNSSLTTFMKIEGYVLSSGILLTTASAFMNISDFKIVFINIPVVFMIFLTELYFEKKNPFLNLATIFLGIIYVTIPCIFIIGIPFTPFEQKNYHHSFVLGYFFIVWANDTGAYIFGKLFGKHFLFKRISPKKTWEGSIGGAVCTFVVAYIVSLFCQEMATYGWVIVALIVIVIGTFGDLVKSLLKRSVHVKDSGTILPGHGGILDRFDSMLSSAPFVFCYLFIFK